MTTTTNPELRSIKIAVWIIATLMILTTIGGTIGGLIAYHSIETQLTTPPANCLSQGGNTQGC